MREMESVFTRKLAIKAIVVLVFVLGFLNEILSSYRQRVLKNFVREDEKTRIVASEDRVRLVHVISPYVVPEEEQHVYPLDMNQWAAMESIRRALLHITEEKMEVQIVCAIFETDFEPLLHAQLPCHRFVFLNRSTRTMYPKLEPQRDMPFISDMIETATSNLTESSTSFHVLLSNADIGLSKGLYGTLFDYLQSYDALSINRVTIPVTGTMYHNLDADSFLQRQVDRLLPRGQKHPGFDFFCMSSSVLERVSFGEFFLGRPPWGTNVHLMLKIMADNYTNIKSNSHGTFHLGNNATKWRRDNGYEMSDASKALNMFCPSGNSAVVDELSEQSILNCAMWFLGKENLHRITKDTPVYVPAFVRPGFGGLYLQRYSKHLWYADWGIPKLKGNSRSIIKKKRERGNKLT